MADVFSKKKRSEVMSRIRGENTAIELQVFSILRKRKIRFKKHYKLPGKPDVVVPRSKKVIFIDGDFWHGWRFSQRRDKLPPYWVEKIENNVRRDRKNRRKLRNEEWEVLRIWEHELKKNPAKAEAKIAKFLEI